jgi:hypothetical protein
MVKLRLFILTILRNIISVFEIMLPSMLRVTSVYLKMMTERSHLRPSLLSPPIVIVMQKKFPMMLLEMVMISMTVQVMSPTCLISKDAAYRVNIL